ncbi:MAG: hypothetical protein L6246_05635 [Thermodesulfovibrionales bacterium]|nr:hypothetical protein [Thermodesulfovibrionales bacterium]
MRYGLPKDTNISALSFKSVIDFKSHGLEPPFHALIPEKTATIANELSGKITF